MSEERERVEHKFQDFIHHMAPRRCRRTKSEPLAWKSKGRGGGSSRGQSGSHHDDFAERHAFSEAFSWIGQGFSLLCESNPEHKIDREGAECSKNHGERKRLGDGGPKVKSNTIHLRDQ